MRRIVSGSAILIALVASVTMVLAAVENSQLKGRPALRAGMDTGYYLWRDYNGFHLRCTTKNGNARFSGRMTIRGEGSFSRLYSFSAEESDHVQRTTPKRIEFDFRTAEDLDGFDVRANHVKKILVELYINNRRARPTQINLGRRSSHPERNPLLIKLR